MEEYGPDFTDEAIEALHANSDPFDVETWNAFFIEMEAFAEANPN